MIIPDAVQTLSAAFSFGTVLQAALGALFIFYRGHGSTIFQDGRRLVLLLFFLFAALWAQVEFVSLLLAKDMANICQLTILLSTIFDQLARVAIEQFFLWSMGGTKVTPGRLILQGALFLRLIGGVVLVAVTKSQFAPACVARISLQQTPFTPVSIPVLALDAIIVGVLLIREISGKSPDPMQKKSKALIFSIVGLGVWTVTSVPMILGTPATVVLTQTVLPANGLLVLVSIVTMFSGALILAREENAVTPEARSPFVNPMPPPGEIFHDNPGGNGSPVLTHNYTKSGNLFIVNPSATPNGSPMVFQNSSRGDTRGFTKLGNAVDVQEIGEALERPEPLYRGSTGVIPATIAASQAATQVSVAPPIRPHFPERSLTTPVFSTSSPGQKRSMFNWSKTPAKPSIRSLGISLPAPHLSDGYQSLAKIPTIDLATAADLDRKRREEASARSKLFASGPQFSTRETLAPSSKGKLNSMPGNPMMVLPVVAPPLTATHVATDGTTTSASISPGREEVRRRSPRKTNSFDPASEENAPRSSLQRKNTNGLPSNSKASSITMVQEVSIAKPQTVMFINDIVYDNPGMVNTITNASAQKSKIIASVRTGPLKSADSIIHRPRPCKRNTSGSDRALFPSEPSPGHVRSKSVSAIPRTSDFLSLSGSPSQLPALPALPNTRAAYLKRLLPSDTVSMYLDEKIEFLFPATPGPGTTRRRRSSVPSLPRVPSMYLSKDTRLQSPTGEQQLTQKAFEGTTIAPGIPLKSLKRQTIRSPRSEDQDFPVSTDLYKTIADEVGAIWNPPSHEGSIGDVSTYWESIPSEVSPADLSRARQNGGSPYLQRPDSMRELPPLSPQELREDEAIVPMMLDSEENRRSFVMSAADNHRQSFLLNADQLSFVEKTHVSIKHGFGWHYRIGDDLPTFSERSRSNSVKRKMPPPTPLLLHRSGRRATVVVRNAEPSPPIDSPERAIADIQEQLRRFEQQPSRVSVASLLRRIPGPGSENERGQDTGRFRLLENLEKEMGQQENQWQRMQSSLGRDSISISPYAQAEAENSTSQKTSQGSPNTPSMASSIRARFRSSTTVQLKSGGSSRTTPTAISENPRASIWQQRLAEAQVEYMENAPDLLRKKSLNFLPVTKGKPSFVSSTPPDSGESETELETDFEPDSDTEAMKQYQPPQKSFKEAVTFWRPSIISPEEATGHMWSSPYGTSSTSEATSEPPAKNMRPAQRHFEHVLPIFSTELWIGSSSLGYSPPVVGLWGSKTVSQTIISTHPTRQRPRRKSKRMTFLPDIVESPLPIPNKRDTLGIFQFSSGELSDQPIYQPTFDPAIPKRPVLPALASKFNTRSRQLEPEKSEYSSSLFDESEEEDLDLNYAESDDEFDESTLWEIADLLNAAPSQASLLPASRDQAIQDYDTFSETQGSEPVSPILSRLPIQPPAFATRATAQLWAGRVYGFNKPAAAGLPQPESAIWNALVALADDVIRVRPRSSQALPVLSSMELWVAPAAQAPTAPASSMWSNAETEKSSGSVTSFPTTLMWSQPTTLSHEETIIPGLFDASILRSNYRSSDTIPAVISMVSKPRKSLAPLSILTPTSTRLWSGDERQDVEVDWISISSTRPESPSVYSTASSGTTSPVSDAFSVRSSSTNASSIWSAETSTLGLKWGSANKSPVNTPKDDSKHPSRIPVRQPPQQHLASVRESSVLSSRDLWESRAPALEKTAVVRKVRRGSTTQPNALSALKLKLQRKRMVYSPAEWEKSLAEAIAASLPKNISGPPLVAGTSDWEVALAEVTSEEATLRLRRPAAMESDWEAALSRAVFKSSSRMTYSPEQWEAALLEAITAGTATIPNVAKIYPAPVGRSLLMPGLWTSSVIASTPTSTAMWSKSTVPLRAVAVEMNHVVAAPRKALATIIFELPMLKSQSLWTPVHVTKEDKDWLGLTARRPTFAQTWTPRAMPGGAENTESLWTTETVSAPPMPDMLAHVKSSHIKLVSNPSRPSPLPRLDSVQLFALDSTALTENSTHWLHKASIDTSVAVAPKVLKQSMTWTARASEPSIKQQGSMWQARPTTTPASPDLFQNIHSESWSRTKRDFEAFMAIESTGLWQPPMEVPVSVKSWIVN